MSFLDETCRKEKILFYKLKIQYTQKLFRRSIGGFANGAPRSAWRTVGENPTQTKSSQQFGTDHYVA
ncbi:hypothetical protein [Wolbachia endosymbiont (group A) of Barypeithes pellucidus]|uniref:hypothetical protein n=1 Tax=Wolbachia endosymbiont (group A) of Barypeithes pellucidus TaxID=3139322 RepID=UPI003CCB3F35